MVLFADRQCIIFIMMKWVGMINNMTIRPYMVMSVREGIVI